MSELLTAARPYAKALHDVASQGDVASWVPLMQVCQALGENDASKHFLNAYDLTQDKFDHLLRPILAQEGVGGVPGAFDTFVALLAKNKRFALLPDIAALFIDEVNKSNQTIVVEIIAARPLSEASYQHLIQRLTEKYDKTIEASTVIDKSLIGGAIIRVGDHVIDGSVKGRLEQLAKALN